MERKDDSPGSARADQARAQREHDARALLREHGADRLEPRPWLPAPAPTSAVDLTQFALWRAGHLAADGVLAALTLLPAARAEVDGVESGLLFVARSAGLTWAQIADAMGFNSPQACQQHFTRLSNRQTTDR